MKTFTGEISVTDFAPKADAGSSSVHFAPSSPRKTTLVPPSPLRSPPIPGPRRERVQRYQRSRSAPDRGLLNSKPRRSSTFEISPPRKRSSGQYRSIEIGPELRDEVISLFALVSKRSESPLRPFQKPAARPSDLRAKPIRIVEHADSMRAETEQPKSIPRRRDFESLDWLQQKRLLNREFRRLVSWTFEPGQCGAHEPATDRKDGENTIDAFALIGKSLVKMLADDMLPNASVSHVERLVRNAGHRAPSNEAHRLYLSEGSFENLQNAINLLFELPRKGKNASLDAKPSVPGDTTAILGVDDQLLDGPPRKAVKVGPAADLDLNASVPDGAEVASKIASATRKCAEQGDSAIDNMVRSKANVIKHSSDLTSLGRFNIRDMRQSIPVGAIKSATKRKVPPSSAALSAKSTHQSTDAKIVLEIADRINAFLRPLYAESSNSRPCESGSARPHIRRFTSGELPNDVAQESSLVEKFEEMTLNDPASLHHITEKLLKLARPRKTPLLVEHPSQTIQALRRFDQILGLIASLPAWRIYTITGQRHEANARSAISLIYLSLLEELVDCAVVASHALQEQLKVTKVSALVKDVVQYFSASMKQLSAVRPAMNSTFETLRPQLDAVVEKLKLLDRAIAPGAEATTPIPTTAGLAYEYEPLALAIYLCKALPKADGNVADCDDPTDKMGYVSVQDLFRSWSPSENLEGAQRAAGVTSSLT